MVYSRQPTNFYKDKSGQPLPVAEAKAKIEKEILEDQARRLAVRAMNEFTHTFDLDKTNKLEDFTANAVKSNLTVRTTAPFGLKDGPAGLELPERALSMLFRLQESEPVMMTPVGAQDGAYLFALKQRLPREIPPLATVRAKVIEDYKQEQSGQMSKLYSQIFHNTLTNGLAQGKSLTEICLESKRTPIELPKFSRVSGEATNLPATLTLNDVRRVAFELAPNSASQQQESAEGWFIVYVRNRLPVDEVKLATEMPKFLASLRAMRQNESASEWIGRHRQSIPAKLQESTPKGGGPAPMPRPAK
jgi:peptidyl-prolyl cis-trans isomerase D